MATNGDGQVSSTTPSSAIDSSRAPSASLQAAAALNAGQQHESARQPPPNSASTRNPSSPTSDRRRSAVPLNLQLNNPSVPGPGEMGNDRPGRIPHSPQAVTGLPPMADVYHHRAPSLGELHQELEAEQEGHVNRLLQMIRQQQLELQRLQASRPGHSNDTLGDESAVADTTSRATAHGAASSVPSHTNAPSSVGAGSLPRSPGFPTRGSMEMARAEIHRRSRTPSRGASPRLRSTSFSQESGDWILTGGRDEGAFYQAETQMLTRENQMLRHRIRELEKQLAEATPGGNLTGTEPSLPSQLTRSSVPGGEEQSGDAETKEP